MQRLHDVFIFFIDLIGQLIVLLAGIALFGFLWGVLKYIVNGAKPEKRAEGKKFILYGLLSLLVITSLWGFVLMLQRTFGFAETPFGDDGRLTPSGENFDIPFPDPTLDNPYDGIPDPLINPDFSNQVVS